MIRFPYRYSLLYQTFLFFLWHSSSNPTFRDWLISLISLFPFSCNIWDYIYIYISQSLVTHFSHEDPTLLRKLQSCQAIETHPNALMSINHLDSFNNSLYTCYAFFCNMICISRLYPFITHPRNWRQTISFSKHKRCFKLKFKYNPISVAFLKPPSKWITRTINKFIIAFFFFPVITVEIF